MTQMLEENFGLNTREYPDDNFDHIRGLGSPSDSPSRLQQICSFKLKDVQFKNFRFNYFIFGGLLLLPVAIRTSFDFRCQFFGWSITVYILV